MKHIDLFSGIGGFALAADRVFGEVEHVFCDNDPFCQLVLNKHWPNAQIYGDIRTLTNTESERGQLWRPAKGDSAWIEERLPRRDCCDLLTGGFPCQPFSQAGRRRGTEDDRYLWPEMLRVIREFKPTWVIGENVGGLVTWNEGLVLEQVHLDLEAEGYEVQAFIIPAVAVNAPHRRDRVWIVGHSEHDGLDSAQNRQGNTPRDERDEDWQKQNLKPSRPSSTWTEAPNWNQHWLEVAARLCRVDDGLPRRLDRNPRLKALGNAIVPQVAEEIMLAVASAHTKHHNNLPKLTN